jgi:hypothetical protein
MLTRNITTIVQERKGALKDWIQLVRCGLSKAGREGGDGIIYDAAPLAFGGRKYKSFGAFGQSFNAVYALQRKSLCDTFSL